MENNSPKQWRRMPLVWLLVLLVCVVACAGGQKIKNEKQAEALRQLGEAYLADG